MPNQTEILDYLGRSGDQSFRWNWPCYEFDGGWFNWFIAENELKEFCIGQAYGDHELIADKARQLAKASGCEKIVFATKRNARAFERLTGARIVATVLELPLEARDG